MAGLLESLAQILPYAIPAAAGAALGGPGLGMVGAGGAAAAKAGALDQQMKLAQLMSDSDYRNKELGLRGKEIDTNEALRKQQAAAEQQYRSEMLNQRGTEFDERAAQHKDDQDALRAFRDSSLQMNAGFKSFEEQMMAARLQDDKDKLQSGMRDKIGAQMKGADTILAKGAKQFYDDNTSKWGKSAPIGWGGAKPEDVQNDWKDRNREIIYRDAGVTPERMKAAGYSDAEIVNTFPGYGAKSAGGASPAGRATAGGGAARPPVRVGDVVPTPHGEGTVAGVNMDGSITLKLPDGSMIKGTPPKS